ncbi:hypothetical protein Pcac1_g12100 [Phytophthora cactorum]|nr:hypothetical protein Pcac1_g12100 [Phytophthora cactorum]
MVGVWKLDEVATVRVPSPKDGKIDQASREPTTLINTFKTTVARCPNDKALSIQKDGHWVSHTWQQYYNTSQQFARGLIQVGVQPHEAVNVLGENCPEWLFTYMGTVGAGAVIAGIYGTSNAEACQHISAHCEAKVVVVSDKVQLDKYLSVLDQLPALTALVVWNESDVPQDSKYRVPVYSFSEFLQLGNSVNESLVEERMTVQQPGHCCSLIYTSGAAPTSLEVMHFFASLNMPLYELFGQTESTGPLTFSMPNKWKLGTVGPPLEGTQARIDPETGEIQYTGRHVFMGYLHDEEATKKTVDENGWLYSGDIGELDEDGFLSITGRLKELIITSGGENIPPVLIENEIKAELPALSNVMVIGEKRNYLTFLCSLRVEPDTATGAPTDKLDKVALAVAKEIGSDATTVSDAQSCEKFRQYISDGMARANTRAASRAQQVQKFSIIPRDFSIGGNELTPTMKVKRSVVEKMYMENIEKMYTP